MLVHSFSQSNEWFSDYAQLLALFDVDAQTDSLVFAGNITAIDLYFGWVRGDKNYLHR